MKIYAIIGCIALAACQPISSPATYANTTTIDERAGIEAETAYSAFALAANLAVNSGLVHGTTATNLANLDNKLYSLIQLERTAYKAGNAADYNSAVAQINTLVVQGLDIINVSHKP